MPQFGSMMVVATAHFKHRKEFKDNIKKREKRLYNWEFEKQKRLEKIRQKNENTKVNLFFI